MKCGEIHWEAVGVTLCLFQDMYSNLFCGQELGKGFHLLPMSQKVLSGILFPPQMMDTIYFT